MRELPSRKFKPVPMHINGILHYYNINRNISETNKYTVSSRSRPLPSRSIPFHSYFEIMVAFSIKIFEIFIDIETSEYKKFLLHLMALILSFRVPGIDELVWRGYDPVLQTVNTVSV